MQAHSLLDPCFFSVKTANWRGALHISALQNGIKIDDKPRFTPGIYSQHDVQTDGCQRLAEIRLHSMFCHSVCRQSLSVVWSIPAPDSARSTYMSGIEIFVDREPRPMLLIFIERDPLTGTAIRKTVGVGEV